jgi:hypothetical protein
VPTSIALSIDGLPAPEAMLDAIQSLEVEENVDDPDALLLRLPANRNTQGELTYATDGTFTPYCNLTLTVTTAGVTQCIFDGYVLSWKLHLDRSSTASTIEVLAQDSSWLMNLDDSVREWSQFTDGQVANEIFGTYGFATIKANTDDDSPQHLTSEHTLMQRDTDLQFLRSLAQRTGRVCRVSCADTPGVRTGYFIKPSLDGPPVGTLSLVDAEAWNVDALDLEWDIMRPTEVTASGLPVGTDGSDPYSTDAATSGLPALDATDLRTYAGRASRRILTATADIHELPYRASAVLRDAGWFVRCRGEADAERLGVLLRTGTVVALAGAGALHSGNWFVWSVHHRITPSDHRIQFTLARNALGRSVPATSDTGLLGGQP